MRQICTRNQMILMLAHLCRRTFDYEQPNHIMQPRKGSVEKIIYSILNVRTYGLMSV